MNQLSGIEDQIGKVLLKEKVAFPAVVITSKGMREFVFYSDQPEAVRKQIAMLGSKLDGHEIQSYVDADSSWTIYRQFTK